MRTHLPRAVAPAIAVLLGAGGLRAAPPAVDFVKDVQPILQARCAGCHGAAKQRGGFRIDRKDRAMQGGDSGPAIVPGKSAASLLVQRVASTDKAERMPANGDPLTPEQVRLLRAWIDQGAPWPETAGNSTDTLKTHWSFQPVRRPALPAISDTRWPRNAIDHFILARLEKEKLAPSPEADRRTLLRRLSFDLVGLPPSPEEVQHFVADSDPLAYEKVVDRLLASPHYGERWARHWLDVVRFAESHGFEMNQARANAWPYRDWVIRAFNEDLPYDRFVRDQIAGDAAGADAATGFLVGGPWDQVKSPDPGLTAQQRADELHDMVGTTAATFLGLTLGCARCHNHKFDPITQNDYYAVTAVFAGVQHGERPQRPAGQREETAALARERATIDARLAQYQPKAHPGGSRARPPVSHRANEDRFEPVEARFVRFTALATRDAEPCLDELEVFTTGPDPHNVALASAGTRATASGTLPGFAIHRLEHVHDGRYGNDRSWIADRRSGWVMLAFNRVERIDRVVWSRDRSDSPRPYQDRVAVEYRIETSLDGRDWRLVADSSDRIKRTNSGRAADVAVPADLPAEEAATLRKLLERRREIDRRLGTLTALPPIYAGRFEQPGLTHRLHRGDPMQPREVVRPGAIAAFGARLDLPADAPEQERRLALAAWITDPRHPLTARVLVNRLWHYHFGEGLVSTPSDFGVNGARPTHPELLDWLAAECVERRWSIKEIHRLIVLSATYRQSGRGNARGLAADAGSRLLWRYPPRRLEAEPLRDAILAVCGNLDRSMGGPGFDLFEPNANYVKVYTPKKTFGPPEWRRMVYQAKPRMQLDDVFGAFDCPDAGQIAPRRTRSTTPLQALNLLNSPFILRQAVLFAGRLEKEAGSDPAAQARRAFRLAFGREPDAEETAAAARLIRTEGLPVFCRALLNANEFVTVD
jgi:mono/diheme cytochrome c family protein